MVERFLARFQPCALIPGVWGALKRVWGASTASTVRLGKNFIKQKLLGRTVLVRADHIFGPIIWIWKDLGTMCFWSHGQPFSGKVY
jgi:hypothetical protein